MADNEVSVTFRSTLPEQFQVPEEVQVQVSTSSVALELGQIVKQLLAENDMDESSSKLLQSRKLMFMA